MNELTRCLWRSLIGMLCLTYFVTLPAELPAKSPQESETVDKQAERHSAGQFIRVNRNEADEPTALETAIVRYVPASGEGDLVVDLISVVHFGERSYYQALNKHFEQYDVLLYELVAPEGARPGRDGGVNPIALLMKAALELESQTEWIDYTKENFVHADLSPQQMAEHMRKRGEDGFTLMLNIAADLFRQQNVQERRRQEQPDRQAPQIDLATLLFDPDAPRKLKHMMAEQFEDLDTAEGLGQTLTTLLITDRNQAAMRVLQTELDEGRKRIGIFYGAAHMPDFEKRLKADFGLKRDSEEWLTAWELEAL